MDGEENHAKVKTVVEHQETEEVRQRWRTGVVAKLLGARSEVEDVLLSSSSSVVLLAQERVRLLDLVGAVENIVRRIEEC